MKNTILQTAVLLLVLVLFAPAFGVGAFAMSGQDPLYRAVLDEGFEFTYTPPANSEYAVYAFAAGGGEIHARVQVMEGGQEIASGEGTGELCRAWMVKGEPYTIRMQGSGAAMVEVARAALSRCQGNPLELNENESTGKMIASAYDAHWYAFTAAEAGEAMLACVPEDMNLNMQAWLFDESGRLAGEGEVLPGGACSLKISARAGERFYVRISAPEGGEGYYALDLHRRADAAGALGFARDEYLLAAGGEMDLAAELDGAALLWISDAPETVRVTREGVITALRPGEATITAYGMDRRTNCRIRVEYVPLEGLEIIGDVLSLNAGDDIDLQIELTPDNASEYRLYYRLDDPGIAEITPNGVLRGIKPGETTLTVYASGSGLSDSVRLVVEPAVRKYRALLVGEQNYPFSENTVRNGSDNSVQALRGLLESVRFENAAYAVTALSDLSRSELIAQIRTSFEGATGQDVSLFYITCHGSYTGGMSFLELSDGSTLSLRDLERELRRIPGTVVVLVDCCGSGGAIGAASDRVAFARGVTGVFAGASVRGSKYKVIASAGLDQDSYRMAFNENADAGVMATVFARALCDGAGWNLDLNTRGTMGADADYNGEITMGELQLYVQDRVNWYTDAASALTGESYFQSVQVYPEGDPLVLFKRTGRTQPGA